MNVRHYIAFAALIAVTSAAASAENQSVSQNAAAVNTLSGTVTGLKANQSSLATTVSDETARIKKAIESPNILHYKGITLAPYGFFNGDSAFRTHATGGEEATPWSSIPYEGANSYSLTEMSISGRQSRIGLNGSQSWLGNHPCVS